MKPACRYCGKNPVPHRVFWYHESLNILFTPLRQRLLYNPLTTFLKRRGFDQAFAKLFLGVFQALRVVSRRSDSRLCKVRRAQVLWEEGEKRGIAMEELLLFGRPFDTYVASQSASQPVSQSAIVFSGLPRPLGYFNRQMDLMDDKAWLKKFFIKNNLPVPAGGAVTTFNQALKVFNNIQKPVIVKPRAGSRGRHSTTFIYTEKDLKQAYKIAKQLCHWVMVEEQLFGPVYRATVINFELAGVLRGDYPEVTGDGATSISLLIAQKNGLKPEKVKDIIGDQETQNFLARQNLKLSSVPGLGQKVSLSEKVGLSYGGSSSEDFEICHPENKEMFVRAARALGDPIVGFDFIIADIAKSFKEQKCGFIEVNSLPFINLHHDPLLGRPRNAAGMIWNMLGW